MKKAQILSAIALAFALGVVAPVAGAHAQIVGTAEAVAEVTKNIDDAIAEAQKVGGDGVFAKYDALIAAIANANTAMNTIKEEQAQNLVDAMSDTTDGASTNDDLNVLPYGMTAKDGYAKVSAAATNIVNAQAKIQEEVAAKGSAATAEETAQAELAGKIIDKLNAAITAAQTDINTQANTNTTNLLAKLADLTDTRALTKELADANGKYNEAAYAKALAVAEGLDNYAKYEALSTAVATAYNAKQATTPAVTAETAATYVTAIENAIAAFSTETPTDPEGPNDTNKPGDADNKDDITNPGNTGVISGTNGTASSTVAVVAGIATALTAAGAGVVAYRNARREA